MKKIIQMNQSLKLKFFFDKNGYGSIKINVTKNETLSKERKIKAKDKHSLFNNVLIVYIDAISRNVFQRKLHKLAEYIEQFMPYNTNENEKIYSFPIYEISYFKRINFT